MRQRGTEHAVFVVDSMIKYPRIKTHGRDGETPCMMHYNVVCNCKERLYERQTLDMGA